MSSELGERFKISIFGESHGEGIGVVVNGFPSGEKIDLEELESFLSRRAPGRDAFSTKRKEGDKFEILSGFYNGRLTGAPFCAIIRNTDTKSKDYSSLLERPRPGHADFTGKVKYNEANDPRGGGHFSGRLTAPLCIAGGIAKQVLSKKGIEIFAHISEIGGIADKKLDLAAVCSNDFFEITKKPLAVLDDVSGEKMADAIKIAAKDMDSLGGVIECAVLGVPVGIGSPMFDGIENIIARIVFGIPAVKGIEFGAGFESSRLRGSQNNDEFCIKDGKVLTKTNNHGGALGGISSGMPIVFRTAIKPTPSIARLQKTVDLKNMEECEISIHGRHDPCIGPRAVPVIEAAAAIAVMELLSL